MPDRLALPWPTPARHILLICLALLVVSCSRDKPSRLTATEVVLAVGDSLTHGYGVDRDKTYPAQLQARVPARVVAAGENGETSAGLLRRLEQLLSEDDYDWVLICTGGNDMLRGAQSALASNLLRAIEMVRAADATPALIAVPRPRTSEDHPVYRRVARQSGAELIDGLGAKLARKHFQMDRIHPNAAGYRLIAEHIADHFAG